MLGVRTQVATALGGLILAYYLKFGPWAETSIITPSSSLLNVDHVRIVHRTAPKEVQRRFNNFIIAPASHLFLRSKIRGVSLGPSCLSLVYFEDASGSSNAGTWGLLLSYDDERPMPDKNIRFHREAFDKPSFGYPLPPLDPTTDRFVYAIAPRLHLGRLVSGQGKMLVPKPTGKKPASLVGALLVSTEPNHSGATATIGGIIIDIPYTGQLENVKSYHGVSICTEQEEYHKWEKERKGLTPSETVIERGKQEVSLAPLDESPTPRAINDNLDPFPAELYQEYNPADSPNPAWSSSIHDHTSDHMSHTHCAIHSPGFINNLKVEKEKKESEPPQSNTLSSGESIGLSEQEPVPGTILHVATAAGWGALPRLELLDLPLAWLHGGYTIGWVKARQLQILPDSAPLHPRDIGAWIVIQTRSWSGTRRLKACYQIVALGEPDIVYAVPIMKTLIDAKISEWGSYASVSTFPVR